MLEEDTVFQAIFTFALDRYGDHLEELFETLVNDFPEKDWDLSEESWWKNMMCFLMYKVPLSMTNRTIAEEFAQSSDQLNDDLRNSIMQMRTMIRSDFIVLSTDTNYMVVKDRKTGIKYKIKKAVDNTPLSPNLILSGRIHPFGDHYRFTGIFNISKYPLILDPEVFMIAFEEEQLDRIEEIRIRVSSSFTTVMNKCPIHWIDWICQRYKIQEKLKKEKITGILEHITKKSESIMKNLSSSSKEVLWICLEKGGYVKMGALKDFEDDSFYFWKERSKTPIGELRQAGLLFVGGMKIGNRNYRVDFIPIEICKPFETFFDTDQKRNVSIVLPNSLKEQV